MSPRLIVFDVDGTLVDSQNAILDAMAASFAAVGRSAPPDPEVLAIVGLSLNEAIGQLTGGAPPDEIAAIVAAYRESFTASRARGEGENVPLYPGAVAAIEALAAAPDTKLGIATGKMRPGLDHLFHVHPIGHHFATLQTADRHPSKPHPAMLHAALAETGAEAGRAAMVGDTEFDMAMGRAAGFTTIAVDWGYHPRARLEAAGPDIIISHFDQLEAALARLGLGA